LRAGDSFDAQVASTTCNMNGKVKNGKVSLMTLMLQTGQTTKCALRPTARCASCDEGGRRGSGSKVA
jgi:hypothetical protein